MAQTSVHVVYNDPRWRVEHEGTARSHHYTKDAAEYTGRSLARRMNTELVIHDTDGSVGERESYATEPSVGP